MLTKSNSSAQMYIGADTDITNLVNRVINNAVKENASDIHFEPEKDKIVIRIRVDGILKILFELPVGVHNLLIARLKVMAALNVTGVNKLQSKTMRFQVIDREVDLRVTIFPVLNGDCVVIRILENISKYKNFGDLGFFDEQVEILDNAIKNPSGLILVTGPVGSGRSTTLFSILNKLNDPSKSVVTIEDPVERVLEHVRQTQVDVETGLTFEAGLRFQLKQDVDVIMIGEIRNKETAEIALQAAISGQLVLATIHIDSAVGAIARLLGMGIDPYLVSSALKLVTSQRLARMNCPHCRKEIIPPVKLTTKLNIPTGSKFFNSSGCERCGDKGVVGRFGLHEVMYITNNIKDGINSGESVIKINEIAKNGGVTMLREIILQRIEEGVISPEEAFRLVG